MRGLIVFVLMFVLASTVRAADPGSEEAKAHFRQATAAYNLGNYLEAAKEYEAAYRQTLNANLLFNIGQSYRLGGEGDKAITAYRSFIRSTPRGGLRDLAEAKIREIEEQREVRAAGATPLSQLTATATVPPPAAPPASAPPPAAPPAPATATATGSANQVQPRPVVDLSRPSPATPAPYYKRWPFWTAVGAVAVAAVVVGVVLVSRQGSDLNLGNPSFGTKDY
jgi:tetratricopeptide (TPR) repeat protein